MTKIPSSENKLLKLNFGGNCLKALQAFAYPSNTEDRGQVAKDLKRIYGLKIKNELGEWSYIRKSNCFDTKTQLSERKTTGITPDPDEVFLYRIDKLDEKFTTLLLQNFHQGGMFYTARQFLTFHLNSLGFTPNVNQGQKHFISCEFSPQKVIITESFNVEKLGFFPTDSLYKVIVQEGKWSCSDLEQSEQEKIAYFQNYIKEKLNDRINHEKVGLRRIDQKHEIDLVFDAGHDETLIEFVVKHTITLGPKSIINIKKLSEEDISFKVQPQLYNLTSGSSEREFSKLLSPDLPCISPCFFEKAQLKNKINELIVKAYRDFILILFNIIANLIFSPIAIPEKEVFLPPSTEPYESQNSFAFRMRP